MHKTLLLFMAVNASCHQDGRKSFSLDPEERINFGSGSRAVFRLPPSETLTLTRVVPVKWPPPHSFTCQLVREKSRCISKIKAIHQPESPQSGKR